MAKQQNSTYEKIGDSIDMPTTPQGVTNKQFGPSAEEIGDGVNMPLSRDREKPNPAWHRGNAPEFNPTGDPVGLEGVRDIKGCRPSSWPEAWKREGK